MPSFLDELGKLFEGEQQKNPKGMLKRWAGKDLSESVTNKKLHSPTQEEIIRSEAEKDAIGPPTIGPISIDPTDYIGPGAFAKVGASLKAAASAVTATPMAVAAFRSANNTMLSRNITETIAKQMEFAKRPGIVENAIADGRREEAMDYLLHGKLTQKEITKYGTPEFVLDKWLDSTNRYPGSDPTRFMKFDKKGDLSYSAEAGLIRSNNQELIKLLDYKDSELALDGTVSERTLKEIDKAREGILRQGRLFEDVNLAQKQGKTVLHARGGDIQDLSNDISSGMETLMRSLDKYEIPVESIKDKSLQQIASIVHNKDDEIVRILKKSMEAKNQIISKRTAELFNSQRDPDLGMFVKLTDGKDLAHETDILNHCIGAVGRDNDKYIPAFDTVTGKDNITKASQTGATSYMDYRKKQADRTSDFYSYRPKGSPEFTVQVTHNSDGSKQLVAAYGFEDASLTVPQQIELKKMLDNKRIYYKRDDFPDLEASNLQDAYRDIGR